MEYRKFNCVYCGKTDIDRSTTRTKKFCSPACAQAHFRRSHGVGISVGESCPNNNGVICDIHKCGNCGWNPKVEARRKKELAYG